VAHVPHERVQPEPSPSLAQCLARFLRVPKLEARLAPRFPGVEPGAFFFGRQQLEMLQELLLRFAVQALRRDEVSGARPQSSQHRGFLLTSP
jgi:hypothetical protein